MKITRQPKLPKTAASWPSNAGFLFTRSFFLCQGNVIGNFMPVLSRSRLFNKECQHG
jgi:hypothetical protein